MKALSLLLTLHLSAMAAGAQTPLGPITFFSDTELRRAIQTAPEQPGQPGLYALRLSPESEAEVVGIRRTAPAKAEQHADVTDIWYVVDGEATLVTGGSMLEGREVAPGELRGPSITNGTARRIANGDYAVIPAGTPHWISSVEGEEFLYIVVKVPSQEAPHR